jgi:amino acid transporter
VAYGFVRLAGEFSHAGSVYAFVGNTLGPRPGFLAGWALLGTYLVFPPVSIMGVAVFGRAFLSTTGLASDADWYPLALAAWVVIWVLAARGVRPTTRSVLAFEVVSVCLILVLMGAICWRLAAGTSPGGQRLSGAVFVLPQRMIPRAIITAVVFGAVFYVACITVQTFGFGTGPAGVSAFRRSQAPLASWPASTWAPRWPPPSTLARCSARWAPHSAG